ncbi:DNA-binding transcriptional MerR regulator [Mycobacterium sp. BK558]|nr:DNA-binding transcriptional MerR regulator [Mycobacterium sp. BK558]
MVRGVNRMRISELAARTGLPVSTLRHYQTWGLLPAQRSEHGYRVFDEQSIPRLRFIRAAKDVGVRLDEIAVMLTGCNTDASATQRSHARSVLTQRLDATTADIAVLSTFRETLSDALTQLDSVENRSHQRAGHSR